MFGPDLDDDGDFELFGGPGKDLLFKSSTKKLLPLTPECDSKVTHPNLLLRLKRLFFPDIFRRELYERSSVC